MVLVSAGVVPGLITMFECNSIPWIERQPAGGDIPIRALIILHIRIGGMSYIKPSGVQACPVHLDAVSLVHVRRLFLCVCMTHFNMLLSICDICGSSYP